MIKTIAIIAAIIVVAVAALLVYAATRPDSFRVQRTVSIKAPPERIFALIDDFRQWRAWSPYEEMDPAMERTLSGAASGKGAVYAWRSAGKPGEGRMEITDSASPSRITISLEFFKPFAARNVAEFHLVPEGESTRVTWNMHGPSPFVAKLMGLFFSLDRMIGRDFEAGLAKLKAAAEG